MRGLAAQVARLVSACARGVKPLAAVFLTVGLLLAAPPARAHNLSYAMIKAQIDDTGTYTIETHFHVAAFLLGQPQAHLDDDSRERWSRLASAELAALVSKGETYFRESFEIYADGRRVTIDSVTFPDLETLKADGLVPVEDARPSAPVIIRGRLTDAARSFQVAAPLAFTETLLSVSDKSGAAVAQVLREGQMSHPFVVSGGQGVAVTFVVPAFLVTFQQYTVLGFEHILPKGIDHILFVVGLFLLTPRWKSLALQVTAFTLAHSVTLALAVFGVIAAPAVIVEPLIAATIVAVAIDNVVAKDLRTWRTAAVFGFGLLHGLGFASVLSALGLPKGEEALALISFNIGVELGQIAVLALAFLLVGWFRHKPWFRPRIAIPASIAIAAIGAFWTFERVAANLA